MRLVQEGGRSNSGGPAVPEDVEESALVKMLLAVREEHSPAGMLFILGRWHCLLHVRSLLTR